MAQIRYSFGKANKNDRSFQMSKQEELIEQKKREIEKKLAERQRKEVVEAPKKVHVTHIVKKLDPDGPRPRVVQQPIVAPSPVPPPVTIVNNSVVNNKSSITQDVTAAGFGFNAFSNDGSFMEQFMRMQQKPKGVTVKQEIKQESLTPPLECYPVKVEANLESTDNPSAIQGICMKLQPSQKNTTFTGILTPVASAFREDEENSMAVSPPDDLQLKAQVDALAQRVVEDGPAFEEIVKQECRTIPGYEFLYDPNDILHQYYQQRIADIKKAKRKRENFFESGDSNGHLSDSDNSQSSGSKRRKSRWGPPDPSLAGAPSLVNALTPVPVLSCSPALLMSSPGLVAYALKVYGTTDLSPSQWSQLEEQMKMRILVEYLMVKKRESEKLAQQGKVKYEYDSDEEVDGGTWEHKRRTEEMEKTKAYADMLTDMGRGKHHIGDFLPPEELSKFMEKYEAIKAGRDPDVSDYKEFKLTEDNIGYRMLQKLGWKEGMGLGADGSGITAPINKAAAPVENSGFGQGRPDEIKQGDDEYDAYRKRMMLAYRFRPNPLNNPRRPYY